MNKTTKTPLIPPILRWFMLAMVLANIAAGMYEMLMPNYLVKMGADIEQVGIVFTIVSVVALIMQIFGGWISDTIGRLKAIAIGSMGGVVAFFFMAFAPTWQWMLVALCLGMMPRAVIGPSFGAFIAENSDENNRGKVYGITDTVFQITGVVGPPLGGFLAGLYGFKIMLFLSACLYSVAGLLRVWMATTMKPIKENEVQELSLNNFGKDIKRVLGFMLSGGIVTWILITDGINDIAFQLSGKLEPLYLEEIGGLTLVEIGFLSSFFSVAMMIVPFFAGRLSDRYGERVPIALGFGGIAISMFTFLLMNSFAGFALVWVMFGVAVGLLSPAYQSLISKVVPNNMLGTFNGFFRGSIGFIALPAPYLGALLWEKFSPQTPFIVNACLAVLVVFPIWFKFKLSDKTGGKNDVKHPETSAITAPVEVE